MHQFSLRVYYEDTDLAGIVYYALMSVFMFPDTTRLPR